MIYAKKIKAEYTVSPFDTYEEAFDCAIEGNDDLYSWKSFEYSNVKDVLDEGSIFLFMEETTDFNELKAYFDDQFCILHDLKEDEVALLKKSILDYEPHSDSTALCKILTVITGSEWDWRTIRGSVQREWNIFYYNTKVWSEEDIRRLEIEYFNLGTEYECSYSEDMKDSEWIYCHGSSWDEDKQEILDYFKADDATLLEDNYDDGTYEGYLRYCHDTNGEPYSREEWERITGIHGGNDEH